MTAAGWEKDDQPGFSVLQTSCNGPSRAAAAHPGETGMTATTRQHVNRPARVIHQAVSHRPDNHFLLAAHPQACPVCGRWSSERSPGCCPARWLSGHRTSNWRTAPGSPIPGRSAQPARGRAPAGSGRVSWRRPSHTGSHLEGIRRDLPSPGSPVRRESAILQGLATSSTFGLSLDNADTSP